MKKTICEVVLITDNKYEHIDQEELTLIKWFDNNYNGYMITREIYTCDKNKNIILEFAFETTEKNADNQIQIIKEKFENVYGNAILKSRRFYKV